MDNVNNIKTSYYVYVALLLLLIFTNPSRSAFASYLHRTDNDGTGRDFNGLIFSIYSDKDNLTADEINDVLNGHRVEPRKVYYLGILLNFIKM